MNKYQEALDKFVRWNAMLKLYGITANERHTSAKHTLQELVDKATPIEPTIQTLRSAFGKPHYIESFYCPTCTQQINIGESCRNNECRQAIDWSTNDSTD